VKDSILIVGDHVKGYSAAAILLHIRGMHVLSAPDAASACDILSCEGAAVVVLDLTFPDTKGFEVLRRLRGRFETRVLPTQPRVVVLADWPELAIERLAVGLGADAFLRKPVAVRQLLWAIEPFLPAADAPASVLAVNG
jgi:DNA-binding response OmpR family regulator